MSDTTIRTEAAFAEYQQKKASRKLIAETIKDAMANDSAFTAAEDDAKVARGAFKAEKDSFKAKNAHLFDQLGDAKAEEKEAKLLFDEHYEASVVRGEHTQLSLFDASGQKVLVTLTTKIAAEKEKPATNHDDDAAGV